MLIYLIDMNYLIILLFILKKNKNFILILMIDKL